MYNQNTDTIGRRYVQPNIFNPTTSSGMMGVWLHEDEEVEWHIFTNADGTQHCYGYTVKKKGGSVIDHNEVSIGPLIADETLQAILQQKPHYGEITVQLSSDTLDEYGF